MSQFPTRGHLVSGARVCPSTIQSGPGRRVGRTGEANAYLKRVLGEAAAAGRPISPQLNPVTERRMLASSLLFGIVVRSQRNPKRASFYACVE